MAITGANLIAGELSQEGEHSFTSVNPRSRQPGAIRFYDATDIEVDRAARAARAAFDQSRNYPSARLADFLDRVADEIESLGSELLETADWETALGIPRLTGERARTTNQLRKFGALLREGSYVEAIIDTNQPERQPNPRPSIRRMLFPVGPVAVFSASNFPFAFAVAGGDSASAWAAGCPVIVKGHPGHPATSECFANAINKAVAAMNFPAGFFSLLQGSEVSVGQTLVMHPAVSAVAFTGSLRAGRAIYDQVASRPTPIPVYAEMGSVNPIILLPCAVDERAETIADGLKNSVTLGSGQFCTNPGLVLMVEGESTGRFIERFTDIMASSKAGPLLNEKIEQGLAQAVAQTLQHSEVECLLGAEVVPGDSYCYAHTVMRTTSAAFRRHKALQNEHFGPVTLFVLCDSVEDLMETVESLHGSLTATVHAADSETETAARLYGRLREKTGRLIWNGFPTGVEVVYAMQHGGPYPATTAPWTTSVGMAAIKRFMRPIAFQNVPESLLPSALQDSNPLGIWRLVNEEWTREPI